MMEETSSDEQPEIVTREEVEQAEKEATKQSPQGVSSNLPAPSPLPSFLPSQQSSQTPTTSTVKVSEMSVKTPASLSTSSTPKSGVTSPPYTASKVEKAPVFSPEENKDAQVPMSPQPQNSGLFGWISGNSLVSKVVEKTKSSVESVITTLDPGMKEVMRSGGDIDIIVTSTKESKVGAVRDAFQEMFGRATVNGLESDSGTAAQPVGYTAGLKGAEERIQNLKRSSAVSEDQVVVSVEGFIVEMLPDKWFEMSCIVLQDPVKRVDLQMFSQPTPIPTEYVHSAQDQTPSDYPLRWAGLSVSIGHVIEKANPHIGHADWQKALVGVSRRETLSMALRSLAYLYLQKLPSAMIS